MGLITFHIDKKEVDDWISDKASNLPSEFSRLIEDFKEIYGIEISIFTPVDQFLLVSSAIFVDTGPYSWIADNEQPYFPYVILGTSEHWIGSVVFISKIGEFRYIGMHPGTAPNDYQSMAYDAADSDIDVRCDEFLSWITE